jgi:hypothetical protein
MARCGRCLEANWRELVIQAGPIRRLLDVRSESVRVIFVGSTLLAPWHVRFALVASKLWHCNETILSADKGHLSARGLDEGSNQS